MAENRSTKEIRVLYTKHVDGKYKVVTHFFTRLTLLMHTNVSSTEIMRGYEDPNPSRSVSEICINVVVFLQLCWLRLFHNTGHV